MSNGGIADYRFVELIGTGNHGAFYKAVTPERLELDSEFVAVKRLNRHATDDEFRRFVNELRLFAAANSPHLTPLYDAGQQDGVLFYATHYYAAGSLGSPSEDLDATTIVLAVASAARGADALHEVGVAHRDIKPTNVMLGADRAALGDLGLAQVLNPGLTATGFGPIGALEYMEPGVARGDPAGRASDIWQLGLTLHRALASQGVYPDMPSNSVVQALEYMCDHDPVIDESLPDGQRAIIQQCLEPRREDRPATAGELADELERLVR
jgi:serine/threonine protein kinase